MPGSHRCNIDVLIEATVFCERFTLGKSRPLRSIQFFRKLSSVDRQKQRGKRELAHFATSSQINSLTKILSSFGKASNVRSKSIARPKRNIVRIITFELTAETTTVESSYSYLSRWIWSINLRILKYSAASTLRSGAKVEEEFRITEAVHRVYWRISTSRPYAIDRVERFATSGVLYASSSCH